MVAGYVTDGSGRYLVQVPDPTSRWGFFLADADQSWDGGFGSGFRSWHLVPEDQVPPKVRRALGWILSDYQP